VKTAATVANIRFRHRYEQVGERKGLLFGS
jgi:hypothetical protein